MEGSKGKKRVVYLIRIPKSVMGLSFIKYLLNLPLFNKVVEMYCFLSRTLFSIEFVILHLILKYKKKINK